MAAPAHIARENGKKGGRPRGRKNAATLERDAQLDRFRQRVFEAFDPLIEGQIASARGVSHLFKLDIHEDGSHAKPILVDDPEEIAAFLANDYNELETTYYYITTKAPDIPALKDLWDRALGKPAQQLELGGLGGDPLEAKLAASDRTAIDSLRDLLKQRAAK